MQTTTHCNRTNLTIILILTGLAALMVLPAEQAIAQTPLTKIENSSGDSVFVSFDDGALLGLGIPNVGIIPVEGAGVRMMWYPGKAAFRAGRVGLSSSGDEWDEANVGNRSVAFGVDTEASGSNSTAMGAGTNAGGSSSTAIGLFTTASGNVSTAMGDNTTAATENSLSIGQYNSANTSADNTLLVAGNGTSSTPSDALVLDKDAGLLVTGEFNTGNIPTTGTGTRMMWYPGAAAFRAGKVDGTQWDDANIGAYSVAFGRDTRASGIFSVAMGDETTASGNESMAMGSSTTASGDRSMTWGSLTTANSQDATAWGDGSTASGIGATAMGGGTTASGVGATTMGSNTIAATDFSLSIGEYNSANTSDDGTLFVVGNGSSGNRSNALMLDDSGNLTISGTLSDASDRRLKKEIKSLGENILRKLDNIHPVSYQFKNQQAHPAGTQIGLVAQEVQKQFPELVSEASNGYLSVSYSKFTAVLLKGLQEQQQEIQTLKDEKKNIKKRLAKLEQQNSRAAGLPWSMTAVFLAFLIGGGLVWKRKMNNE